MKLMFFPTATWLLKYFKVVANSKKLLHHKLLTVDLGNVKYFGNMSHFSVTNKVVWMSTIATIFFPFMKEFGWLCGKFKGIGNCIRPKFHDLIHDKACHSGRLQFFKRLRKYCVARNFCRF